MCFKHILDKSSRLITIPVKTINCDNMSLKFQKFVLILTWGAFPNERPAKILFRNPSSFSENSSQRKTPCWLLRETFAVWLRNLLIKVRKVKTQSYTILLGKKLPGLHYLVEINTIHAIWNIIYDRVWEVG